MSTEATPTGGGHATLLEGMASFFTRRRWSGNLSRELKIVYGAAIAAILIGLATDAFLDGKVGNPEPWYVATGAIAVIGGCIFVVAVVGDLVRTKKNKRYLQTLEDVYRAGSSRERASIRWSGEGPEVAASDGPEIAITLARQIARETRASERRLDVAIAAPGRTILESLPNLDFKLPQPGPERLAGYLADVKVLSIDPVGTTVHGDLKPRASEYSLMELSDLRAVHVEPGLNRIQVNLPWGSWIQYVDARLSC